MAHRDIPLSPTGKQQRGAQPHRDGKTRDNNAPRWTARKAEKTKCACGADCRTNGELKRHLRESRGKEHRAIN